MENNPAKVELRGIRKAFGHVMANEAVNLRVRSGSIHAIVGENGAGKSTAMKILYGQYSADEGEILIDGKVRHWRSSADAIDAGIGMVHQHFMLAGNHDAVENVLLGTQRFPFALLPKQDAKSKLTKLMNDFKMEVELTTPIEDLPVGMQQRIEILKLLYRDSDIMILDEPTAVLAPGEIETLFETLRKMAKEGKTILIITHKLKEVMAIAESVTVFRAGRVVGELPVATTNATELASMMVGREVKFESAEVRTPRKQEVILEVKNARPIKKFSRLKEVSFKIQSGEILGVAGVEGNGQTELIRLLLQPKSELGAGSISLLGKDVSCKEGAALRAEFPIGFFPEDRLREALLLHSNVEENFLLGKHRHRSFRKNLFFLNRAKVRSEALNAVRDFDVRPATLDITARDFSGGNQQKLVVARELKDSPRFLLAAQPTRGVDIGAIEFIHEKILALRNAGSGVLLLSSELEEVLKLSDRVIVLFRGQVVGEFSRSEFDERKIGLLMACGSLQS